MTDERFEGVQTGSGACISFADDWNDGRYSGETGKDVRIQCVETVGEGVVIVGRCWVDHVKSAMNVSIKMFLGALHFCFLLSVKVVNEEHTSAKVSSYLPVMKLIRRDSWMSTMFCSLGPKPSESKMVRPTRSPSTSFSK